VQVARSGDGGSNWSAAIDLTSSSATFASYQQIAMSGSFVVVTWAAVGITEPVEIAVQASSSPISSGIADASVPRSEFRFVLPDGRECSSISPQTVVNFTQYQLPGDQANCRTPGAVITGWRIPGQSWAFGPSGIVNVVDSQTFTAVLREPVVRVVLDANVAASDACTLAGGASAGSVPVEQRAVTLFLQREDMTTPGRADQPALASFPAPAAAVCTPPGHRLVGWSASSDGIATRMDVGRPFESVVGESMNTIRVFAVWAAA
jgi:hypothetical protein